MAWIDAPHLSQLHITFFMDPIFDVPHLHRFISCVEELKGLREAIATFCQGEVVPAALMCEQQAEDGDGLFMLQIRNRESDRQRLLSSMAQLCHSSMAPFSSLEWLKIYNTCIQISNEPHWNQDMERTQWLAFLEPFIAVKDLQLIRASCTTSRSCLGIPHCATGNKSATCITKFLHQVIGTCSGAL